MLNQLTINCGGEESLAEMTLGFLGQDEVWVDKDSTLKFEVYDHDGSGTAKLEKKHKAGEYYIGWRSRLRIAAAGTTPVAGNEYAFFDFSMSLNNNLTFPDFITGSFEQSKPERSTLRDITGSFTLPFQGKTDYDNVLSWIFDATPKSLQMTFWRHDDIVSVTPSHYFIMTFNNVVFLGDGSPGSLDSGLLRIPVSFKAFSSADTGVPEIIFSLSQ